MHGRCISQDSVTRNELRPNETSVFRDSMCSQKPILMRFLNAKGYKARWSEVDSRSMVNKIEVLLGHQIFEYARDCTTIQDIARLEIGYPVRSETPDIRALSRQHQGLWNDMESNWCGGNLLTNMFLGPTHLHNRISQCLQSQAFWQLA